MGTYSILSKMRAQPSVLAAYPLRDRIYEKFAVEEGRIVTSSSLGMPIVNKALEEVLRREVSLCVFCHSGFHNPVEHQMVMEDANGNRVGHDVPACMFDHYKNNPEIVWLGDYFAMYPNMGSGEIKLIMLPLNVNIIGKDDGAVRPILMYPAMTTDIMLKRHFAVPSDDPMLASAILSFDLE